ncbi:hypothetical protein AMECASPLE_022181 [Ameca splendens]|uniref:Transmembrane protein n=1 Tax=Ameca splendens TaxID=208324 RepID=A0ABV0ZPF4_9TELE
MAAVILLLVVSLLGSVEAHNRTTAIVSIVRITLVALLVVVGTLTVSILTCKKKCKLLETVYEVPPPQVHQRDSKTFQQMEQSFQMQFHPPSPKDKHDAFAKF